MTRRGDKGPSLPNDEEVKKPATIAITELSKSTPSIEMDNLLTLEYYLLKKFSPAGIYIVPHYEEHITSADTVWDGVVFVEAGPYKNGKFWFFICFPEDYPKSWPRVQFHSLVYHPLINPQDGSLDLRMLISTSKGDKQFESLAMKTITFIKQIFYCEEYWKVQSSHNVQAGQMFVKNRSAFLQEAKASVADAEKRLYLVHQNSTLRFGEPKKEHETILEKVLDIDKENVLLSFLSNAYITFYPTIDLNQTLDSNKRKDVHIPEVVLQRFLIRPLCS